MKALLRALLRVFPPAFRAQFGADVLAQIEHDYDDARTRGLLAAWWCAIVMAADLIRSGLAERVNPTWVGRYVPPSEVTGMSSIIGEWVRDLRVGARSLRRAPGFTTVAVVTLGLAIGANAGMFSVVNAVLLHPLPYAHADRLVYIAASAPGSDFPAEFGAAAEFYLQYKEARLIEDVATYNSFTSTLRVGDRVERIRMSVPTNSLFAALGAQPILGRLPVASDENRTIVISYALWKNWFGGDSSVIGRAYSTSGAERTVIGIMGPAFRFPDDGTLLWISNEIRPEGLRPGQFGQPMLARMVPGATPEAVARELTALSQRLPERFGGPASYARLIQQHRAVVRPLEDEILGSVARSLWVLLGAVGIVLVIACANVSNLFMVRAESRQRDLAVRRAIGAARRQLMRLQISETVVVAALAGGLAILLAYVSLPVLLHAAPPDIPRIDLVRIDGMTWIFTLAAALVSAIACGLIPAVRSSSPDLTRLREGGRGSTRRRRWVRDGLVAAQTALALVLLIGSGLLVRSFWHLRHVDPGYSTENIFTFQIAPERPSLRPPKAMARFDLDFMNRLRALPGVETVGLVENIPLNEGTRGAHFRSDETAADATGPMLTFTFTAGDYFKAMSIHLRAGRTFSDDDHLVAPVNVIISRSAANALWPGRNAIGRRIKMESMDAWYSVVGVVDDVMQYGFRDTPQSLVYFPLVGPTDSSWSISSPAYVVKTARAETIAPEIRALVHDVAPEAPMYRVYTMARLAADSMVQLSFTMLTLGIVSALALILGAVGLYGVLSYIVAERTREIGVRMAIGARAEQVRRMVVAEGARVLLVGVTIGIGVALASTRVLQSLLFGVAPLDVTSFVGMSVSMIAVGLLASYVPARRASNVDPIESLRSD